MVLHESAPVALEGSPYQTTEQQVTKESNKKSNKMTSPAALLSTCRHQAMQSQNFRGSGFFFKSNFNLFGWFTSKHFLKINLINVIVKEVIFHIHLVMRWKISNFMVFPMDF